MKIYFYLRIRPLLGLIVAKLRFKKKPVSFTKSRAVAPVRDLSHFATKSAAPLHPP
jgi:hypothetical protein